LQRVDVENGSRSEKLALFINVFNMMVIHATVKLGAPGNIWQRRKVCHPNANRIILMTFSFSTPSII
jgi:hypothetical protein